MRQRCHVSYVTGAPAEIGLQLGKACYPCSRKGERGNVFISSVSSLSFIFLFLPCPSLSSPLLSLFSLSLGDERWFGVAKVLCILRHRGVQQILAYSCARLAILVAGKGRGGMFLCLLFLHFHSFFLFLPCPSLSSPLLSLFSLSLGDNTK